MARRRPRVELLLCSWVLCCQAWRPGNVHRDGSETSSPNGRRLRRKQESFYDDLIIARRTAKGMSLSFATEKNEPSKPPNHKSMEDAAASMSMPSKMKLKKTPPAKRKKHDKAAHENAYPLSMSVVYSKIPGLKKVKGAKSVSNLTVKDKHKSEEDKKTMPDDEDTVREKKTRPPKSIKGSQKLQAPSKAPKTVADDVLSMMSMPTPKSNVFGKKDDSMSLYYEHRVRRRLRHRRAQMLQIFPEEESLSMTYRKKGAGGPKTTDANNTAALPTTAPTAAPTPVISLALPSVAPEMSMHKTVHKDKKSENGAGASKRGDKVLQTSKASSGGGKGGGGSSRGGCTELVIRYYQDEVDAGASETVVGDAYYYPIYDASTNEQLGVYSDAAVLLGGKSDPFDCVFNGAFNFDFDATFYNSQIMIAGTCGGSSNAIVGGTGTYACASGFSSALPSAGGGTNYTDAALTVCGTCAE